MQLREDLNIAGRLTIRVCGPDNRLIQETTAHNDIAMTGRDLIARLFNKDKVGDDIKRVSKIQLGKSGKAFDPGQNGLDQKIGETAIKQVDQTVITDPTNGKPRVLLRLVGELGENDCNDTLQEAGLFTDDGVMYNRVTFPTITKSNQFKLTLIWEILF